MKSILKLSLYAGMLSLVSSTMAIANPLMYTKQEAVMKQLRASTLESYSNNSSKLSAGKIVYFGGPVIGHAQVFMILWGNGVVESTKKSLPDFYSSVLGSTYMDWLKMYNTTNITSQDGRVGTNQQIGRGTFMQTIQINPSIVTGSVDDEQIRTELEKNINAGVLPKPTADTLFMIHFPANLKITFKADGTVATSCQHFCAYHNGFESKKNGNIYYGVIPNLDSMACSFGCGSGGSLARQTVCASHELIEAVTDAFPTPGSQPAFPQAWNTPDGSEVGDLCQSTTGTLTGKAGSYKVQQEWDNSANSCTTGNYQ